MKRMSTLLYALLSACRGDGGGVDASRPIDARQADAPPDALTYPVQTCPFSGSLVGVVPPQGNTVRWRGHARGVVFLTCVQDKAPTTMTTVSFRHQPNAWTIDDGTLRIQGIGPSVLSQEMVSEQSLTPLLRVQALDGTGFRFRRIAEVADVHRDLDVTLAVAEPLSGNEPRGQLSDATFLQMFGFDERAVSGSFCNGNASSTDVTLTEIGQLVRVAADADFLIYTQTRPGEAEVRCGL